MLLGVFPVVCVPKPSFIMFELYASRVLSRLASVDWTSFDDGASRVPSRLECRRGLAVGWNDACECACRLVDDAELPVELQDETEVVENENELVDALFDYALNACYLNRYHGYSKDKLPHVRLGLCDAYVGLGFTY